MKKGIILLSILVCVLVYALVINPPLKKSALGDYNLITRKIRCFEPDICLHEIGHKVDHGVGLIGWFKWVSDSEKFRNAVDYYRRDRYAHLVSRDRMTYWIMFFPGIGTEKMKGWGGYKELYADILKMSGGAPELMPVVFREFYDWERIWELQEQYPKEK